MTDAPETLTLTEARRRWRIAQRLLAPAQASSLTEMVSSIGWVPMVSGASAYLALFARGAITLRAQLDDAVFVRKELAVVPGPRGLLWLVPSADAQLARAFALADHASRETRVASSVALTSHDLSSTRDALRRALEAPRLTPELRGLLPPASLRPLGDVGRRAGCPTVASMVLRSLWINGEVERMPAEARVDCARVRYRVAAMPKAVPSAADAVDPVAGRWLSAHAPTTLRAFAAALGIATGRAQSALRPLKPRAVVVEGLDGPFVTLADPDATLTPTQTSLLPPRDPLTDANPTLAGMIAPAHLRAATPRPWGAAPIVLHDGEIVGRWSFDEAAQTVCWSAFQTLPARVADGVDAQAAELTRFVTGQQIDLGGAFAADGRRPTVWADPSVTEV